MKTFLFIVDLAFTAFIVGFGTALISAQFDTPEKDHIWNTIGTLVILLSFLRHITVNEDIYRRHKSDNRVDKGQE
jgi:hypothetical protein